VFRNNFSGMSEIYLVRVTRSMPLSSLPKQFDGHLLHCGRYIDKVLYEKKTEFLGTMCATTIKRLFGKSQQLYF
jgi:hypothetical protein